MDHPGYEVVSQAGDHLTLKVMGGLGVAAGRAGAKIKVITESGEQVPATTSGSKSADDDRAKTREAAGWLATDTVYAKLETDTDLGLLPRPAVPDLPDFLIEDDLIYMRAADDLAGCAAILAALEHVANEPTQGSVYGIFTRAEEVGLIGARLAAEHGLVPKNTVIVSVETSSVLPGAEIGNGIVIRTGDSSTTFDHDAEAYLVGAAQRIKATNPEFKFQRQLMSAGSCEATAFKGFGYRVTGTAFPLGAWHNRGETGVEPEFISKDDFIGGAILLTEAAKLSGTSPDPVQAWLSNTPDAESERLRSGLAGR